MKYKMKRRYSPPIAAWNQLIHLMIERIHHVAMHFECCSTKMYQRILYVRGFCNEKKVQMPNVCHSDISYILYHTHHQCRHTRILLKIDTHGISDVCVSTSIVLAWIPAIENMMYIYEKYVKYNERFTHH